MKEVFTIYELTASGLVFNDGPSVVAAVTSHDITTNFEMALNAYKMKCAEQAVSFVDKSDVKITAMDKIPPSSGQDFIDMTLISIREQNIEEINKMVFSRGTEFKSVVLMRSVFEE